MTKARILANLISDNAELADGQISVAEVVGAAPTANPTFTGTTTQSGVLNMNANYIQFQGNLSKPNVGAAIYRPAADSVAVVTNNQDRMVISNTEVNFNEESQNTDFRVESDTNSNALFVDAGNNYVSIHTASGYKNFNVGGSMAVGGSGNQGIVFGSGVVSSADQEWFLANNQSDNNSLQLYEYNSGAFVKTRMIVESGGDFRIQSQASGDVIINEDGENSDFRVESDGQAHMLFVDASTNRVGINNNAPQAFLHVNSGDGSGAFRVEQTNSSASGSTWLTLFEDDSSADQGYNNNMVYINSNRPNTSAGRVLRVIGNGKASEYFSIHDTGAVVVNESSLSTADFRVESDNNSHMLFVDAGNGRIGINQDVPGYTVDVVGGSNSNTDGIALKPLNESQTMIYSFLGMRNTYYTQFTVDSNNTGNSNYNYFQFFSGTEDNNGELLFLGNGGTVFNNGGHNRDFRIEGNNVSNGIVYDADDETVCFFTNTTSSSLPSGINFKRDGQNNGWQNIGHTTAAGDGFSYIQFLYNSSRIGQAVQSGTTGVTYQTTSDYRLKENAVAITSATERVKQLNPIRFNFISEPDRTIDGFLAHEVQAIVPEAVSGTKDEVDDNGNPEYQGLDTSRLVPVLVATIKELEARITALENA